MVSEQPERRGEGDYTVRDCRGATSKKNGARRAFLVVTFPTTLATSEFSVIPVGVVLHAIFCLFFLLRFTGLTSKFILHSLLAVRVFFTNF